MPRETPAPLACDADRDGTILLTGEDVALWAHCRSGLTHAAFVAWLVAEFDALDAIDPSCSQ